MGRGPHRLKRCAGPLPRNLAESPEQGLDVRVSGFLSSDRPKRVRATKKRSGAPKERGERLANDNFGRGWQPEEANVSVLGTGKRGRDITWKHRDRDSRFNLLETEIQALGEVMFKITSSKLALDGPLNLRPSN